MSPVFAACGGSRESKNMFWNRTVDRGTSWISQDEVKRGMLLGPEGG
jgi:hypothetical protein